MTKAAGFASDKRLKPGVFRLLGQRCGAATVSPRRAGACSD